MINVPLRQVFNEDDRQKPAKNNKYIFKILGNKKIDEEFDWTLTNPRIQRLF